MRTRDPIRLHTSENPYGASPGVATVIREQLNAINAYPDGPADDLRAAIARHHGASIRQVTVGNGADEIILLTVLGLHEEGRPWLTTESTFPSYAESVRVARAKLIGYPLRDYRIPVSEVAEGLAQGARGAFVCNPHNPTGTVLTRTELELLSAAAASGGGVLVVDEAYAEFAGQDYVSALPLALGTRHVMVLRTFSKAYGLAGLRVGYAIGLADVIAQIDWTHRALRYHVNRLAQHAAIAALSDHGFVRRATRRIIETREWLRDELAELGLSSPPSSANFVLVNFGEWAPRVAAALSERGFLVRDTADMGLPGHIRISIGTRQQVSELRDHVAGLIASHAELAA